MAQLLTCLKLCRFTAELLINFNVPVLHRGMKRIVDNFQESSAPSRLISSP